MTPPSPRFTVRSFLHPAAWAALFVLIPFILIALPNALLHHSHDRNEQFRFAPWIETVEDVVMWSMLASFLVLGIVKRAPSWPALARREKVGWGLGLVAIHLGTIFAGASAATVARVDSGSNLRGWWAAPNDQRTYLYAGGLDCAYEVYVPAKPNLTLRRVYRLERWNCREPATIKWDEAGALHLVDASGERMERQKHW